MPEPKFRAGRSRRKTLIGTRVLVCGHPVNHEHHIICHLPADVVHKLHVALVVAEGNTLYLAFRETGKRETEWQPVAESAAPQELSTSQEQQ